MAQFINYYDVDLWEPTAPQPLRQMVAEGDSRGLRVGAVVYSNGEAVSLGGSCVGKVVRADGATVQLTGYINGNIAYVPLDQQSCAIEGPIQIAICWVSGTDITTLVIAYGTVVNTQTGTAIQPSTPIPDLTQLLAEINEMRQATAAANAAANNALKNFASAFSETTDYSIGQYVTYTDGKFYRFKANHPAGTWNSAHCTLVTAGGELRNIRSVINSEKTATPGYILTATNSGNGAQWSPVGLPTDAQTGQAVANWLNAHPEATTTVQDGSLTEAKFSDSLKLKTIKEYVTPEMFGAKGDGVTDDMQAIQDALDSGRPVKLTAPSYFSDNDIVLGNNACLMGNLESVGGNELRFSAGHGIISIGRYVAIKNISISAESNGTGAGIYLTTNASHMCQFDNLIINRFAHGIKYDVQVWDTTFSNIRVNNCSVGLESLSATNGMMCTTFINVYFNHCNVDISTLAMKATFIGCNFGIIGSGAIHLDGVSFIDFIGCNFECDEQVTTTGGIFELASNSYIFTDCIFKINGVAGGAVFSCYGVQHLTFNNCSQVVVTGNLLPDERWFDPSHPIRSFYGAIVFDGYNNIPEPNYYNYFENRGLGKPVMFWNTIDTSKCEIGQVLYERHYHKLCYFNGTNLINVVDGTIVV